MTNINLFPWRTEQKKVKLKQRVFLYFFLGLVCAMSTVFFHNTFTKKIHAIAFNIQHIEIKKLPEEVMSPQEHYFLQKKQTQKAQVFNILNNLFHLKIQNIIIHSIIYQKDSVLIAGSALNITSVNQFIAELLNSHVLHSVRLNKFKKIADYWQYELQLMDFDP